MSFLNGIGGFAAGMAALAGNAAADEPALGARPHVTPPDAVAVPAGLAPTTAPVATPGHAPAPGGVPDGLMPLYTAASKRTGIPVAVLIAQAKQESGFRADAVGSAGEIGLHQIKPSTAQAPGWGVKPIDPATLKDPAVNIAFAADYLRARAGLGVDFSDPAAVDRALARYNGGGDANYVANVRRHMGAI